MKNILEQAQKIHGEIVSWRRYFHENAETHLDLPKTTAFVMSKLREFGYEPVEICKSGVLAMAGGKKPGKTFLIRGDMDALPIEEETDLPFKSKTGNMHACGHDFHTAMLLGAAKILKDNEDYVEGTVKLMFQPAEETLAGAKAMVAAGILENPKVDAAMMIHIFSGMPLPDRAVAFSGPGAVSATSDWFKINIKGKGGHGAMPHATIDPLNVAAHIHIALQEINAREIDPERAVVVTVGEMHGGSTGNIIPDTAFLQGTIRTFNDEVREFIKKRLVEISEGIGKTFRCEVTVDLFNSCPSVINDEELSKSIPAYTMELLGKERVLDLYSMTGKTQRMSGSEDFAFVSVEVPSLFLGISASVKVDGITYPQHHPKVVFDESILATGAAVYANSAIHWLKNH
ncbi:MAG: amidohydrolase [Clostridia bacterium]|nr:amidohydrolase [Clostridia bacterium]MBN2882920.1 amidohydrolase [Clostridia bacterium]